MSDQKPSGQVDQASGDDQVKKESVAYESYAKLLSEKKKLQSEHTEARARLEEYEQGKLEAEGKLKEALENQKKLTQQFKDKNLEIVKTVTNKAVRSQFLREAEKLGCIDSDIAIKAVSFEDLEVTEDFEFDNQKLVAKIQELTKSKPYLFKKDFKLVADITPNNSPAPEKSLSEMSQDELIKKYKEISLKGV